MKFRWLAQGRGTRLLVFFNGWGMDERVVTSMALPADSDLLEVHDYRERDPGELEQVLERYASFSLVAWSLGVWAAASVFAGLRRRPSIAVAINGTCRPIDGECGIPPELFRATVAHFSTASRAAFYRRMCARPEVLVHFREREPRRDLADQAAELRALEQAIAAAPAPSSLFSLALIGRDDRIMPPENQRRFWESATATAEFPMPHYPFFALRSWDEILGRSGR